MYIQRVKSAYLAGKKLNELLMIFMPRLPAVLIFVAGAMLIISTITPPVAERLSYLKKVVPALTIDLSHLLTSFVGIILMLVAQGINKRIKSAYYLSIFLLISGAILSLIKGIEYEQALVLLLISGTFFLSRGFFDRQNTRPLSWISFSWNKSVLAVLFCALLVSVYFVNFRYLSTDQLFSYGRAEFQPQIIRTALFLLLTFLVLSVRQFLKPKPRPLNLPDQEALRLAGTIIDTSANTKGALAYLADKELMFSDQRDAFLMFGVQGNSWIVMGDPIGAAQSAKELVRKFAELADYHLASVLHYQVSKEYLDIHAELGYTILKIGEEARVPLDGFNLVGSARADLRQAVRKLEAKGISFEVIEPAKLAPIINDLQKISDSWLASKNTAEKKFSLAFLIVITY